MGEVKKVHDVQLNPAVDHNIFVFGSPVFRWLDNAVYNESADKVINVMMTRLSHARLLDRMQHYVASNLKNRSHTILRLWTDHCEYIIAQKCRRGQQMVSLYTKIWDDRALRELFHRFRRQVSEICVEFNLHHHLTQWFFALC